LNNAVKSRNQETAMRYLSVLFDQYLNNSNNSVDYVKYIVHQIATSIYHTVCSLGGIYQAEAGEFQLYDAVENAGNIMDLRQVLHDFIIRSIQILEGLSQRRYSQLIEQTVSFIEENYTRDLSLDDIAANVHLSPNYLSNVFKTERGTTLFDTITVLRMGLAKNLLAGTDMQIKAISTKVGYNHVQSFIRHFKKYHNLTPEQYRLTEQSKQKKEPFGQD